MRVARALYLAVVVTGLLGTLDIASAADHQRPNIVVMLSDNLMSVFQNNVFIAFPVQGAMPEIQHPPTAQYPWSIPSEPPEPGGRTPTGVWSQAQRPKDAPMTSRITPRI